MRMLKSVVVLAMIFNSLVVMADAAGELQIYNRIKGKSWSQLSSQEKKFAVQKGISSESKYNSWKAQYEDGGSRAAQAGNNPAPSSSPTTTPGTGTPIDPDADKSISQAAEEGAAAQGSAAGINMAAGAALLAVGIPNCSGMTQWGCPLIPMAMLAFAQAGHDSGAAGMSDLTYDESTNTPTTPDTPTNPGGTETPTDPNNPGTVPTSYTGGKDPLDTIKDLGYSLDPKTGEITNPDGSKTPSSAFGSPASMAAAGMSAETIAASQKALAGLGGAGDGGGPSVSGMGVDGGGGGYSASAGGGSDSSDGGLDGYFGGMKKPSDADKKRMIAGKSLNYGSDPIGVKFDNIFMMVHRRYQDKRKVNSYFLERSPASISKLKK